MGEVWRAQDRILGREVAIKLMLSELGDAEMLERFRREAIIAAGLQHPGITVVHDVGRHEGQLFLVMELLPGQDLRKVLNDNPDGLAPTRAILIAGQTAGALAAVHDKGIVHRDLKPENLFVSPGDRVKIGDFGIARDNDMPTLTAIGRPMGTPLYMAPERWEGLPATPATDLYALGCVLYEMLIGKPPFNGSLTQVISQHMQLIPPPPREQLVGGPRRLSDLVMALLAKDPARRPPSAAAVSSALRRMLREMLSSPDGVPATAPPAAPLPARVSVTAPLGCLWSSPGGFEAFRLSDNRTLSRVSLLPGGDWDRWRRVMLPEGKVAAVAVGAARAVANWDRATYEHYRAVAVAVGGTVFHCLHADEADEAGPVPTLRDTLRWQDRAAGRTAGAEVVNGGWSLWEAMRPLPAPVTDLAFAAHSMPRFWDVFALDATGQVHHRALSGDPEWAPIPGPGGRPVSAIAACYGRVPELVAVAGGDVWRTRRFRSGKWQDWQAVLRPAASAVDVALSPGGGDGDLFVLDQMGEVHHEALGAAPSLAARVTAIAASPMLTPGRDRRQVLCALTADGGVHYTSGRVEAPASRAAPEATTGPAAQAGATVLVDPAPVWAPWRAMPPLT
jgi:hypothetical protein